MAHGFLSYEQVSGDNFWKNAKDLYNGLRKLLRKDLRVINANIKEVRDLIEGKDQKALPPAATRMLGGSQPKGLLSPSGGLATRDGGIVGKNPTNIDVKTGRRALPPGGPRLPGSSGGVKGGTFTNIGGGGGLGGSSFFSKTGELDIEKLRVSGKSVEEQKSIVKDYRASLRAKGVSPTGETGAPAISPDSGADIVAAVNRNTQMIVSLVEATKQQTSNDSQLVQQQIQAQETMMSRSAARAEEKALEQGSDLSGFLTPENFAKRKKNEEKKETGSRLKEFFRGPNPFKDDGCGCGIGGGGFDLPAGRGRRSPRAKPRARGGALAIPDMVRPKASMPGGLLRRGGGRALTRGAAMVGGKAAAKGVAKGLGKMGLKKIPGIGAVAGAAFAAERAMKGDWLGAGGELLSGLAGTIPGIGTGVSAAIDAGLMARDAGLTPFARGGIITQPTAGLVGEAGQEGVFPLEGKRGRDTFRMFGEGILEAQKRSKQEFADLQSLGLKQYFEVKGGFKLFGDIFKLMLGPVLGNLAGGLIDRLGNFANGAFGIGNNTPGPGGAVNTSGLADFIGKLESGNDYTKMVGGAIDASVLDKTITQLSAEKGDKFAMGRYQIQMATAKDVLRGAGIDASTFKFDKAGQDKLFELLLKRRGLEDFQSGKITKEQFAKNLSKEWAALPTDASGRGYYDGVGTNKSLTNWTSVMGQLDSLKASGTPFRGGGGASNLAAAAQSLKGMSTADGPDGGRNGCVYAVNKVFNKAGITPPWGSSLYVPDAEKSMIDAGWQQVPYDQMQPGDVFVMKDQKSPPATHIGVATSNKMILSNSSGKARMSWEATAAGYNAYYGGQGTLYRMPGTQAVSTANAGTPGAAPQPPKRENFAQGRAGAKAFTAAKAKFNAAQSAAPAPAPVAATPASTNTGTPIMATSAQVAMAGAAPSTAAPTIINNYYSGGQQSGGVNPNGVSPGIGMSETGTSIFQDLKIRSLA